MTRLGLALTAALLGLATVTAVASAEPTGTTEPSSPPSPSESAPPSSEPSEPPSSEPSVPPSSDTSTPSEPQGGSLEDIEVAAEFDKSSYDTGEDMAITLTVTNTGDEITVHPYFARPEDDAITVTATSTFEPFEPLHLDAGETVTNVLTGVAVNPDVTTATLYFAISHSTSNRYYTFDTPVTKKVVPVSGVVFEDRNGNGAVDSGEGVGDVGLFWQNNVNSSYTPGARTDENGRFALDVVPGSYDVWGDSFDFLVIQDVVEVPASGSDSVLLHAKRKLRELGVNLEFTKDTYKPDEAPTARVTLTNRGDQALEDIVAVCYTQDDWPYLTGKGPGWGDLAGDGLTLAPRTTKTLDVTEAMPASAHDYGFVTVNCAFAYAGLPYADGNPSDTDEAAVPGQSGTLTGEIATNDSSASVAGFHVVLTAKGGDCPIVDEATTGADGRFVLGPMPAGWYHIYVMPPTKRWYFKYGTNNLQVNVAANRHNSIRFMAFPMDADNDGLEEPPNCGGPGTNPPGPQGSAAPGLAYTGTSLVLPGLAGLLAVLLGLGAILVTRRRTAS